MDNQGLESETEKNKSDDATKSPDTYMAFISYRHADNTEEDKQWATWLHQQLEVYDVPPELIGTTNLRGETIPERIYPVFRDEVSLPADADLSTAITNALDRSAFIVILCSPRATKSKYVNLEILRFKQTDKQDRIMAALLLGEPNASIDESKIEDPENAATLECFPEALQYHLDSEGNLDKNARAEPIAADFRLPGGGKGLTNPSAYKKYLLEHGKSRKQAERLATFYEEQLANAKLKIVAGILGVSLEQLTSRDKVHQLKLARKRNKQISIAASVFGVLFLAAGITGGIAWHQYQRANDVLDSLSGNLAFMNFELRDVLQAYVPTKQRLDISRQIDDIVEQLDLYRGDDADYRYQAFMALLQKADLLLQSDAADLNNALILYQQALIIINLLKAQYPDNVLYMRSPLLSHNRIGDVQLRLGDWEDALATYKQSLTIAEQLVALDGENTQYLQDLSVSHKKIGNVRLSFGSTQEALADFQEALTISEKLEALDTQNTEFLRDLSASHSMMGEVQLRLGKGQEALTSYQQALTIAEQLVALDGENTQYLQDLANAHEGIGYTLIRSPFKIRSNKAFLAFHEALGIRKKLAALDNQNKHFLHDLYFAHIKMGDLILLEPSIRPHGYREHYQEALMIAKELVALDETNTQYQWSLASVYVKQGNEDEAWSILNALEAEGSLSTKSMHDLAMSNFNEGNQLTRIGYYPFRLAFKGYEQAITILEWLVGVDEKDARIQSDLSVVYTVAVRSLRDNGEAKLADEYRQRYLELLLKLQNDGILSDELAHHITLIKRRLERAK